MNWLSNFIRPKISSLVGNKKDVPDNLWSQCPSCNAMLFHSDLVENLNVCHHCNHHMILGVQDRLQHMFDDEKYDEVSVRQVALDPLKFKDRKKYTDRLRDTQAKTKRKDAFIVAKGKIQGQKAVVMAFDFSFMGGSMGAAVGEAIVAGAEEAVKSKSAFIVIPASGGARMQEGMVSLMQMPRSIIAVEMVKEAGLPYIVLLTNPTTGGVSASFAMVGDIHISEPGATIGFAGKRVIEQTIREELPEGFQTAEYLVEHGMVDMVVDRADIPETLGRIIGILMDKKIKGKGKGVKNKTGSKRRKASQNNPNVEGSAQAAGEVAQLSETTDEQDVLQRGIANAKEELNKAIMKKAA